MKIKKKLNQQEFEKRVFIWDNISNLFLDRDLAQYEIDAIIHNLSTSDYTIEELNDIYLNEVAPVLRNNLGLYGSSEWSGFNIEWLKETIIQHINKKSYLIKISIFKKIRDHWLTQYTKEEWIRTIEAVKKKRINK